MEKLLTGKDQSQRITGGVKKRTFLCNAASQDILDLPDQNGVISNIAKREMFQQKHQTPKRRMSLSYSVITVRFNKKNE